MFPLFAGEVYTAKTSMFQCFCGILDKPRPSPSPNWQGKEGYLAYPRFFGDSA